MNVEIAKLFIIELDEAKNTMTGSLTVRLPDIGISILGVYFARRQDIWSFVLPWKKATHHLTGQETRYPIISFSDKEQQYSLMESIRKEGRKFIEHRLLDKKTPLIFLKKRQSKSKTPEYQQVRESAAEAKPIDSIAKSKSAMQQWIDPPARKPTKARIYGK